MKSRVRLAPILVIGLCFPSYFIMYTYTYYLIDLLLFVDLVNILRKLSLEKHTLIYPRIMLKLPWVKFTQVPISLNTKEIETNTIEHKITVSITVNDILL